MPVSAQQQQRPQRPRTLERRLSIEETYQLAYTARRKSVSDSSKQHLRVKLGHTQMLEALENVIRTSPPPSPKQSSTQISAPSQHISWGTYEVSKKYTPPAHVPSYADEVDEYGYGYDDDEEDLDSLSLCRTPTRRP